ncbi:MAG TPA: cobalt transporter [Deltaproteobacteria bacterium]|nr:cobalt transporter [Deltaproteobacteria bacterium]HCP45417.1 cobalt transporter [Deltaproteobacteria bacterium]
MAATSKRAVYTAIVGNSTVMIVKFAAFLVTGSAAMLSEAIHSLADTGNQTLLAVGIAKSKGPATPQFPYGLRKDRFVWALVSAMGIFFLGCGVTLHHGVVALLNPTPVEGSSVLLAGVLLFALIVEGYCLWVAWSAVRATQGTKGLLEHLRESSDPMASAVLLEDAAAVLGVILAAIGIGLAHVTGRSEFDAISSIIIGLMMGVIAIVLVRRNRELLLGERAPQDQTDTLVEVLTSQEEVQAVKDVKAVMIGSEAIRFKAEVDFDGRAIARNYLKRKDMDALWADLKGPEDFEAFLVEYGEDMMQSLGQTIDRIEEEAKASIPEVAHIDLEND